MKLLFFFTSVCLADVNECLGGGHNCDQNADCANINGSFTCTCQNGFTGSREVGKCSGKEINNGNLKELLKASLLVVAVTHVMVEVKTSENTSNKNDTMVSEK